MDTWYFLKYFPDDLPVSFRKGNWITLEEFKYKYPMKFENIEYVCYYFYDYYKRKS